MQSTGILASILAATLASFSAGAMAQTATADAEAQARVAQQNAITDRYLTAVRIEMTGRVDTKNAAAGQEVSARTLAEAKLADGTTLPKGTKLVGHVMQVRAGGREEGMAVLALTFDRAELKGGQNIPVRSVIRTVAPGSNAHSTEGGFAAPSSAPMDPMSSTTAPSGRTSTRTGVGLGGGSLPGTTVPSIGGRAGTTMPSMDDPIGGDTTGAGETGASLGDSVGRTIGGAAADTRSLGGTTSASPNQRVVDAGERTSPVTRATALPGVMLSNTAVANASGTLTAFGRNISLESGTQITLGMITR